MNQDKASGGEGLKSCPFCGIRYGYHLSSCAALTDGVLGDMRAEFKAWVESQGCDTDGAWSAWQACWNLRAAGEGSGGGKGNAGLTAWNIAQSTGCGSWVILQALNMGGGDFTINQPLTLDQIGRALASGTPVGSEGQRQEGEAGAPLPAPVVAWRDAYSEYLTASEAYNTRLQAIRAREAQFPSEFGRDNPHAEWKAIDAAHHKWYALLRPMHEALAALPSIPRGGEHG